MKKSNRTSREEWLDFALGQLVSFGPAVLTIAKLCEQLKLTKGSFYHHFSNRNDFIKQLMAYWYQTTTLDFIKIANEENSPLERLQRLDQVIAASNIDAERHIRAWALREPTIVQHLEQIDHQRTQYLSECYQGLGIDKSRAMDIATLTYSNFLGMLFMYPQPSIDTALRISALASKTLIADIEGEDR